MGYDKEHIKRLSDQVKSKISKMTPQNTNLENEILHRVEKSHNFIRSLKLWKLMDHNERPCLKAFSVEFSLSASQPSSS